MFYFYYFFSLFYVWLLVSGIERAIANFEAGIFNHFFVEAGFTLILLGFFLFFVALTILEYQKAKSHNNNLPPRE